jgi:predicted ATPase/DNA-binding SARP family transcriptional activator
LWYNGQKHPDFFIADRARNTLIHRRPTAKRLEMLKIKLLGQFEVRRNDAPVDLPSRPAQSLLAYLVLNAGTAQRRERLAGLLWPDSSETNARNNLRIALWRVRKAIGAEYILADRVSVTFDANADYWLDVTALQQQPGAGWSTEALLSSLAVYAGELLPGFYEEWVTWERERLNAVYEDRMQVLLERLVEEARWREIHDWAERWIAQGQVPEPAYRALMLAHAELGDQAGMAAVYQRCVQALEEELGVGPAQETVQLFQRLSEGGRACRTAVVTGKPERRTNLPLHPTPFVGREALLAEIGARLTEPACRLLTLVGPGGCGKTRLALEAAARLDADAYEHGVFFVSLAPLDDAEAMVPTVAQALGFSFHSGGGAAEPRRQLLNHLRNKNLLLLMDNFEHLLDPAPPFTSSPKGQFVPRTGGETGGTEGGAEGGAQLVTDILQTAPRIKILATSRANLNLPEENRFPIGGMDFPERDTPPDVAGYNAVKLFVQSARRARPDFELTAENAGDVVRICRLVEGMPLGLLLAAPWVEVLTPAEILHEAIRGLDFLETDLHGVPERQRSMRAVFRHSWNLLTQRERALMEALSVFRGGFTRQAVQAVTGATLRQLKGLMDKSLLQRAANGRYQVHELLRQYTADRLRRADKLDRAPSAEEVARDRHCAYYVGFLERRAADLKGPRQLATLAEIEADAENARAAWNWAVDRGQVEWLDQASEGLLLFYERRGRYEQGVRACQRAVESLAGMRSGYAVRTCARVLTWLAAFDEQLGHNESAQQSLEKSLSLLDGPDMSAQDTRSERAFALRKQGNIAMWLGEYAVARGLFEHSLALYRELDDRWGAAIALADLGWAAYNLDAYAEMEKWSRESLAIRQALGDKQGIANSLFGLSRSLTIQGQFEEGDRLARECVAISRETGDMVSLGWGLTRVRSALLRAGKFDEAHSVCEETVAIGEELGSHAWVAMWIGNLGDVQMHLGRYKDARTQLRLSLELARETTYNRAIALSLLKLGWLALVEEAYTEARRWFQEALSVSQATGLRFMLANALTSLGVAERGLGNLGRASEHLYQGLKITIEIGFALWNLWWVASIALLLADEGEIERAVELYALACRYPYVSNSRWFKDICGKHIAAVAATLPPDVVAAAQERGRARDLQATMEELLEELGE